MTTDAEQPSPQMVSRRTVLRAAGATAAAMAVLPAGAEEPPAKPDAAPPPVETYETHAKGLRILPGMWRPHYPWEHIAWVSPSWPSQDYLWLDFPEALFTNQGLLYLSHVNPPIPTVYSELPAVPWTRLPEGMRFERTLPNGVVFGGSITHAGANAVDLELRLENGTPQPLTSITLQTCAFLRAIKEFAEYTRDNKFVHVAGAGWKLMTEAMELPESDAPYRVGWRTRGKRVADLPVVLTVSKVRERYLAFTWGTATLSMVSNANHPCVHADPQFPDLEPGAAATIRGRLAFLEGAIDEFDYGAMMGF